MKDLKLFVKISIVCILGLFIYGLIHIFFVYIRDFDTDPDYSGVSMLSYAIDDFHINISALIFVLLVPSIINSLFPQKLEKLGDYILFSTLLSFVLHAISQLFLGSCIFTIITASLCNANGISNDYQLYRWNPFNLPSWGVIPFYILQIIVGSYCMWRMYKFKWAKIEETVVL